MEEEHPNSRSQSYSFSNSSVNKNEIRQQDTIKQQNLNPPLTTISQHTSNSIYFQPNQTLNQTHTEKQQNPPPTTYTPYQAFIPMKVRNRRFKKLLELRSSGFFDQQAIKLRHPLLYYLFLGQYEFEQLNCSNSPDSESKSVNLLSSFLSNHLINIQYKNLLSQQMSSEVERILEIEKNTNEKQIQQIKRVFSTTKQKEKHLTNLNPKNKQISQESTRMDIEMTKIDKLQEQSKKLKEYFPSQKQIKLEIGKSQNLRGQTSQDVENGYGMQNRCLSDPQLVTSMYQQVTGAGKLTGEDKQIQEQHLIEYCEQLFLEGKLTNIQEINYLQIDHNVQYDDWKEQNKDLEEQYFNSVEDSMDQNSDNYYTGIQDY